MSTEHSCRVHTASVRGQSVQIDAKCRQIHPEQLAAGHIQLGDDGTRRVRISRSAGVEGIRVSRLLVDDRTDRVLPRPHGNACRPTEFAHRGIRRDRIEASVVGRFQGRVKGFDSFQTSSDSDPAEGFVCGGAGRLHPLEPSSRSVARFRDFRQEGVDAALVDRPEGAEIGGAAIVARNVALIGVL